MVDGLEYFAENREACGATWRNFVIWAAIGKATTEGTQRWADTFLAHAKACPQGLVFVLIVRENTPMPGQEVRSQIVGTIKDQSSEVQGWAVVIEGSGFFSSMARSVMAGMIALGRRPFPTKTVGEVDQAVPWLVDHATGPKGKPYSADDIQEALNEVRVRAEMLFETGEV